MMVSFTEDQWEELQTRLEEERQDILTRLEYNDSYGMDHAMNDSLGELSGYDNHPADIGTELFERGKDLALREADSLRLRAIDRALERMAEGEYGFCVHCSREIPFERLQAEPAAERCLDCQEEMEQRDRWNRPVEESFLDPGFGRTQRDDDDQTGYDGEDAWQEVARYGTSSFADDGWNDHGTGIGDDERSGYVEDLEGFLLTDIEGNPLEPFSYNRNTAYRRAARDGWVGDVGDTGDEA
jgi:YteA family regulatory protein